MFPFKTERGIMRFIVLAALLCCGWVVHGAESASKVYFSPEDRVADRLVDLIRQEKRSISVAVYCLTHRGIAEALVEAKKRGVQVEVVVDRFSVKKRAPVHRLAASGIPVFVWDPAYVKRRPDGSVRTRPPLMHDKFCVFGSECVWTGSFNFTFEANHANQENAVVLYDTALAQQFTERFESIKTYGSRPLKDYLALNPKKRPKR
jgi:phosphatidylserine/phosphatidylglycerophosphate/cardiolipin synthase-like enzyme